MNNIKSLRVFIHFFSYFSYCKCFSVHKKNFLFTFIKSIIYLIIKNKMPGPIVFILHFNFEHNAFIFCISILKNIIFSSLLIKKCTIVSNNMNALAFIILEKGELIIGHLKSSPDCKWQFQPIFSIIVCIVYYGVYGTGVWTYRLHFFFIFLIRL